MALTKPSAASTGPVSDATVITPVGQFEDMPDTVTSVPAANDAPAVNPLDLARKQAAEAKAAEAAAAAAAPAVSTTRAVAPIHRTASTYWDEIKHVITLEELEGMPFNAFPKITATLEGVMVDSEKKLGDWIKVHVISWNPMWMVTTGENPSAATNKFIQTSFDGVNLIEGAGTVSAYVEMLKTVENYSKAISKPYNEMFVQLLESEKGGVAAEQKIFKVQLSPQSVGKFTALRLESKMRLLRGKADTGEVYLQKVGKKTSSGTAYATFDFSITKPV